VTPAELAAACGEVSTLQPSNQIPNPNPQRIRHGLEGLNRHVALSPLKLPDVRAIQSGAVGENDLRPFPLEPERPDSAADLLLNVLHRR